MLLGIQLWDLKGVGDGQEGVVPGGVGAIAGVVTLVAPQSMTLPYEYLRALGLTPAPPPVPHGPVEDLLADYGRYLLIERGLTPHTVRDAYVPAARLFLAGRGGPGGCAWTGSLPPM